MLGWFKALSAGKKAVFIFVSLLAVGGVNNAVNPTTNSVVPTSDTTQSQQQKQSSLPKVKAIQASTVTENQVIPFESTTVNDATLAKGQTAISVVGVNGTKTITYKVTKEDGVETSREKVSEVVTLAPITQVTKIGTYVAPVLNCPNGTYVNTAGNTVCSPYSAPSTPSGATAQCRDGSYSFSQSRSGTCSHHGGVATWF